MMKIWRILIPFLLPFLVLSCSKDGLRAEVARYEPTWAAAYEYPLNSGEYRGVGLMLVQGRTDDDLNLSSPGVVASLVMFAPAGDGALLPAGTYDLAAGDEDPLIMMGSRDASGNLVGSFVAERLPERGATRFYALKQGSVTVSQEGKNFHIRASLEAEGRSFEFDYRGEVQDLGGGAYSELY